MTFDKGIRCDIGSQTVDLALHYWLIQHRKLNQRISRRRTYNFT